MYSKHPFYILLILLLPLLFSGCVNYQREMGAENIWRDNVVFTKGTTTTEELLAKLGPPSQIIDMNEKVVLYYLQEQVVGSGLILLLYNTSEERTTFDRAIFVFNKEGVLEDYAYSRVNTDAP